MRETYAGLMQAVPDTAGSMVIIESTANGFNFFKQMWDDAVAGRNDFVPFFAAWYEMEEYRRAYRGEELTAEEEALKAAFSLDNEQLMWRRWCIRNNCNNDIDLFHQEYPATPEEAFLTSGGCIFDSGAILLRIRHIAEEEQPRRGRFTYTESRPALDCISLTEIRFTEDAAGEWYWCDDFLFSVDNASSLAGNREAMWQEIRMNLQTGAFGDPGNIETLIMFWNMMAGQHYPFAAEVKEQLEQQKMQQLQPPMQPQAQESALPRANATDTLTQDSGGDTMNMLGGMI